MGTRNLVGLFACVIGMSDAHAQHPLVMQRLTELNAAAPPLSQQVLTAQVTTAAEKLYADRPGCVASGLVLDKPASAVAERSVFTGALNRQLRGGWTVLARHPACDPAPVRYMVVQDAGGAFRTFRVNRGQSHAHESLIGDTWPLVILSAEAFLARAKIACKDGKAAKLGVTRIADESELGPDLFGVRYKGSWTEIWPVEICSETLDVSIIFTADGDGGAYTNIKGDQIRRVTQPER
jgi:hypothetical protein